MRLSEVIEEINEDVSASESIKHIVDIFTTEFPQLYRQLSGMAENYVTNNGEVNKGLNFVLGGVKSKWYNEIFFSHLKPSLYNLLKSLPLNVKSELRTFLDTSSSFNSIESNLIGILGNIARLTNNKPLENAVNTAHNTIDNFRKLINRLNASTVDSETNEVPVLKKQDPAIQRNIEINDIVNHVLSQIDRRHAGEIRNIVARSSNKLGVLRRELAARGIHI